MARNNGGNYAGPGSRRIDGKPETAADKKFFDLRASGYSGPVKADGSIPAAEDPAREVLAELRIRGA